MVDINNNKYHQPATGVGSSNDSFACQSPSSSTSSSASSTNMTKSSKSLNFGMEHILALSGGGSSSPKPQQNPRESSLLKESMMMAASPSSSSTTIIIQAVDENQAENAHQSPTRPQSSSSSSKISTSATSRILSNVSETNSKHSSQTTIASNHHNNSFDHQHYPNILMMAETFPNDHQKTPSHQYHHQHTQPFPYLYTSSSSLPHSASIYGNHHPHQQQLANHSSGLDGHQQNQNQNQQPQAFISMASSTENGNKPILTANQINYYDYYLRAQYFHSLLANNGGIVNTGVGGGSQQPPSSSSTTPNNHGSLKRSTNEKPIAKRTTEAKRPALVASGSRQDDVNNIHHHHHQQNNNNKKKRSWSRAVFSGYQRNGLEFYFSTNKYITKPDRRRLASELNLTDAQVKVWFQNRRMKWRHSREYYQEIPRLKEMHRQELQNLLHKSNNLALSQQNHHHPHNPSHNQSQRQH